MKLLLTGDSIIARKEGLKEPRLDYTLKNKNSNIETINTAVPGINSGAFFALISDLVLKIDHCDKLILLLGTNDLALHKKVPLEQFKQNMALIISSIVCLYYPNNFIMISPPAVDEHKQEKRTNNDVAAYTAELEQVANNYKIHFINLFEKMAKQGSLTTLCQGQLDDGLHFGAAGYELLADLIIKELNNNS